jgi:hypothetical protein
MFAMKKINRRFFVSLAGFIVTLLAGVSARAASLTVMSSADAGGTCPGATCTLRQAIATANSGDTINFGAGFSTITLTSAELLITKNLMISGPGANALSVRRSAAAGTPNFRIFNAVGNTITISDLTIANGTIDDLGGGLRHDGGTLNVTNCAITGNTSVGSNTGTAGGIYNSAASGTLTITRSSIFANAAVNTGGGIFNDGALIINNCTISGNSAPNFAGIESETGTITITNSTISGNSANAGGGIGVAPGTTVTARNTIIALNTGHSFAPDVAGTITSQGYNLIGNNKDATIVAQTGDQIGTAGAPINPMLGPLQDNGGPTMTQALLSGSTAIEGGDSGGSNTDQRGFARPVDSPTIVNVGDGSDIGAYEVQADQLPGCSSLNTIVSNNNDSGTDSLRGIIANVCAGSAITFAPNVRGTINLTSGELLLNKSLTVTGPGANLLSVQRSAAAGTSNFRIFNIASNVTATISGLTIANGNASSGIGAGGGIFNNGTLTVANVTISGNSAVVAGGGISNSSGTLTLSGSTVSGNSAGGGAGISGGTANVINSTISGNTATGNGGGFTVGTLSLTNSTISGNSASGAGGGLFNNGANGATVTAKSTIVALNTAASGPDMDGALTSQGFNLIGNSSGTTISPAQFTDQVGGAGSPLDPVLGLLQDNGGPTFTRALLSGSPAIDKGASGGLTTDQRGSRRPVDLGSIANATGGDGSDIGAFEVQATTLANVSTRLPVQTADNVLFAGVIVTGTQDKKVIVLAIGPSLTGFGVAGALADPILELYQGDTLLESNDNWIDSANKQAIIDSGLAPTNNLESAIIRTLPANSAQYTAIVRGVSNGTGIGVLQVYDLDATANSKLANISTRGLVQTGDNVLIAGTIVLGQTPQKVLVEALGPSVPVPGNLANPTLELRGANGTLVDANDNWVDSPNKQAIIDSTIPPTNDLESAVVVTLPAGGAQYTAIVRGAGGTTGVAVVEVFALN